MKRALLWLTVIFSLLAGTAWAESWVDGQTADRVHLRQEASTASASLGLYYTGAPVERLSYFASAWTKVRIGTQTGYMQSKYLASQAPEEAFPLYEIVNEASAWVNLLSAPSLNASVLARCQRGELAQVIGETWDGWSYVRWGEMKGYMLSSFLREAGELPAFSGRTQVVGRSVSGEYIHAYEADNRQTIYFTSPEENPHIALEDVNFDGLSDLVVYTSMGASNAYCQLFVFDGSAYRWVETPGLSGGICNMQLYPEQGVLISQASHGSAGAEHEICLFLWYGGELHLARRALAEPYASTSFYQNRMTTTVDRERLHITVRDYTCGIPEGEVLWESILTLQDYDQDVMQEESDMLWLGLREEGNG